MSLYVRSLTSEEETKLNNIALNGVDVKFSRRAQPNFRKIHLKSGDFSQF